MARLPGGGADGGDFHPEYWNFVKTVNRGILKGAVLETPALVYGARGKGRSERDGSSMVIRWGSKWGTIAMSQVLESEFRPPGFHGLIGEIGAASSVIFRGESGCFEPCN